MTTTDRVLAAFKSGFAKANRYKVQLPGTSSSENLNIMCDSVTWPGRQISTNEVFTDMKASRRAYAFIADDVTISFIVPNDWASWNYIHDWHKKVIGNIEGNNDFTVNFKEDYQRDVMIEHLDESDTARRKIRLKGAFPTTLGSMEMGNGNENTVLRLTVTFSYENWETVL